MQYSSQANGSPNPKLDRRQAEHQFYMSTSLDQPPSWTSAWPAPRAGGALLLATLIVCLSAGTVRAQVPGNDLFASRTVVVGVSNTVAGTSLNATREAAEPDHLGTTNGASVWWTWTAPGDGRVVIDTTGSAFDTTLAVYSGGNLTNLTLVGANDDNVNLPTSLVEFDAARNTVYQIAVDSFGGVSGAVNLTVQITLLETAPLILQDARDQTVFIPPPATEASVIFSVVAIGNPAPAYQWQRGGVDIAGATNSTLAFNATTNDAGATFGLVLSNSIFVTTSSVVVLQVVPSAFNDDFVSRSGIVPGQNEISSDEGNVVQYRLYGTAAAATKEVGEPDHAGATGGNSTWWSWTAAKNGAVVVDTFGSTFDTLLAVYEGSSVGGLSLVAQNDDSAGASNTASSLQFAAAGGATYQIAVDAQDSPGALILNLRHETFNHRFAERKTLTGQTLQTSTANGGAARETGEPLHAGNAGGHSLWWTWTAPSNGPVTVATGGSSFDTLLAVYTGSELTNLTSVVSNNNDGTNLASRVRFPAAAGTVYQIAVDGWSDGTNQASGNVLLTLLQGSASNDLFVNRQPLLGQNSIGGGSNVGAGTETGEPGHLANAGGNTAWWSWIAPGSGPVVVDTAGSTFDTVLAVYAGDRPDNLLLLAQNNDDGAVLTSRVAFVALAGREYQIAVDGFLGAVGAVVLSVSQTSPQPPGGNDDFVDRYPITGQTNTMTGVTTNASEETDEPDHADNFGGRSIWWSWVAPTNGKAIFQTVGSDFDTLIAAYTGNAVGGLSLVGSDDDNGGNLTSRLTFLALAGVTYQIAVDGFRPTMAESVLAGNVVLSLEFLPGEVIVPNDHFTNRTVISGTNTVVIGSNLGATHEPGEPYHRELNPGSSAWWSWTAPQAGPVTIDTLSARFDTVLAIYTGTVVSNLTLIEEHDDLAQEDDVTYDKSRVVFEATAGTSYQIAVDGYAAAGEVVLTLRQGTDDARAPVIAAQPQDSVRFLGGQGGMSPAVFRVNVLGSGPLSYRWQHDGIDVIGATNRQLTIANPDSNVAGSYQVLVTNSLGSVQSEIARLVVLADVFNNLFANRIEIFGGSVTAFGTPLGARREAGEPEHSERPVGASVWWKWTAPSNGPVRVDTLGSTFDTTLAVYLGTSVAGLTNVAENDDIEFDMGELKSAVLFDAVAGRDYAIAVDGYKTNFSAEAIRLAVTQPPSGPQLTAATQDNQFRPGASTLLSVSGAGVHPVSNYQWYQGGNLILNATGSTLRLNDLQRSHSGQYSVTVSNLGGVSSLPIALLSVRIEQILEEPQILADGRLRLRFRDSDRSLATDLSRFEIQTTENPTGPGTQWTTNSGGVSVGVLVATNALGDPTTNRFLIFEQPIGGVGKRFYRVVEK
jgi:hypothetical protein